EGSTQIERTLLQAACELTTDRTRAAELLHDLVIEIPREIWTATEWDATVATRLRLAVDADAEREFLQILHEQPMIAGLLEPRDFRVLAPPTGNLPWNRMPDRTS